MLKIGVISLGFPNFEYEIGNEYYLKTIEYLKENEKDSQLIYEDKIIIDEKQAFKTFDRIQEMQVDVIIVQLGTFTSGRNILKLLEISKNSIVFLWGFPDLEKESIENVTLNSITGLIMATSFFKKLNRKFSYAFGNYDDEAVLSKLKSTINVAKTIKTLKKSKFCVVGTRAPGFYLSEVDHLEFKNIIGPEIIYMSISEVIDRALSISDESVDFELKIRNNIKIKTEKQAVEKNIRLYLALKELTKEHEIDALTIQCWPEFQSKLGIGVCGTLSMLVDCGIMASCEGDIPGLATMYIQHKLTGKTPFFTDLVTLRPESEIIKAWHCGQGPTNLAKDCVAYENHPTMKTIGMGVQYDMVTSENIIMAKLSECSDGYRLFYAKGKTVEPKQKLKGIQTEIIFESGGKCVLDTIIENGIEHHFSVIHQDISKDLSELCYHLNLKAIAI